MRVVVASDDVAATTWVETVLRTGGFSVVVVPDATEQSPELHGADVLIVDSKSAHSFADVRQIRRLLLAPRGKTLDMDGVRQGFADIIVVPSDEAEVVERGRHAAAHR